MPRKKKSESSSEATIDDTTSQEVSQQQSSPSVDSSESDTVPEFPPGDLVEGAAASRAEANGAQESTGDKPPLRPVRHTFTSKTAGVHAGEDKRFKVPQAFVDFDNDQRATDAEKTELRGAGFRYRPSDKGYSTLANPETRQARDELAQKFTERRLKEKAETGEGQER